jgi:hypothetical protein
VGSAARRLINDFRYRRSGSLPGGIALSGTLDENCRRLTNKSTAGQVASLPFISGTWIPAGPLDRLGRSAVC